MAFLAQRNKGIGSRESTPVYDVATEDIGLEVEALWRATPGSQTITYQLVARLAHYYGVSYQAATYRLKALSAVNQSQSEYLLEQEPVALAFLDMLKMKNDL